MKMRCRRWMLPRREALVSRQLREAFALLRRSQPKLDGLGQAFGCLALEARNFFVDRPDEIFEIRGVATARAHHFRAELQLSQRFLDFVAAVAAGDFEALRVHAQSFEGGVDE